jgi:hypothetical protein
MRWYRDLEQVGYEIKSRSHSHDNEDHIEHGLECPGGTTRRSGS